MKHGPGVSTKRSCLSETSNGPTSNQLPTEKKAKSLLPNQGYTRQDKVSTNLLFPNCPKQVRKQASNREQTAHLYCAPTQ